MILTLARSNTLLGIVKRNLLRDNKYIENEWRSLNLSNGLRISNWIPSKLYYLKEKHSFSFYLVGLLYLLFLVLFIFYFFKFISTFLISISFADYLFFDSPICLE